MFSKNHRASSSDVKKALTKGRRFSGDLFTLYITPNDHMYFGVVVPKRVNKKAIKRNKIKRTVLHILKTMISNEGRVNVVMVNKDITTLKKEDIEEDLKKLLDKAI